MSFENIICCKLGEFFKSRYILEPTLVIVFFFIVGFQKSKCFDLGYTF